MVRQVGRAPEPQAIVGSWCLRRVVLGAEGGMGGAPEWEGVGNGDGRRSGTSWNRCVSRGTAEVHPILLFSQRCFLLPVVHFY